MTDSGINLKTKNGWKVPANFDFSKFNIENMTNFYQIKDEYKSFKNGVDVVGMTLGSILSCNIITPILRNKIAADRQKKTLARMNTFDQEKVNYPRGISMDTYQKYASMKYSSPSLKI